LSWLRPKHQLALEILALRHQITVLRRQTHKPKLRLGDRLIWILLQRCWADWKRALLILQPETVIGWQRGGLRVFWRWKSRPRMGRPGKDRELIQLIRRMWSVNPTWGSPRIRDELAKLGLEAATATIRKYRPKSRRRPSQSWWTFLQNHAGGIAAIDFFLVPTVTFRLLHVMGIKPKLISARSPWQSPYVERFIGSIRRECLDRVVVINERQGRPPVDHPVRTGRDTHTTGGCPPTCLLLSGRLLR